MVRPDCATGDEAENGRYAFAGDDAALAQPDHNRFEYLVLGDCRTREGLVAPYDEEDTSETFLIESLGKETVFDFWRDHANEPLWRNDIDIQELADPE